MAISEFDNELFEDYENSRKNEDWDLVNARLYKDNTLQFKKRIYSGRHYIREDEDEIVNGYKVWVIDLENEMIKTYKYEERI